MKFVYEMSELGRNCKVMIHAGPQVGQFSDQPRFVEGVIGEDGYSGSHDQHRSVYAMCRRKDRRLGAGERYVRDQERNLEYCPCCANDQVPGLMKMSVKEGSMVTYLTRDENGLMKEIDVDAAMADCYPNEQEWQRRMDSQSVCCECGDPFDEFGHEDQKKVGDDAGNAAHADCAENRKAQDDLYRDSYRDLR